MRAHRTLHRMLSKEPIYDFQIFYMLGANQNKLQDGFSDIYRQNVRLYVTRSSSIGISGNQKKWKNKIDNVH